MKVAIIGAGLAGLACAYELERYGISPTIYERNSFIGEQHPHVSAILDITHRPVKDLVEYLGEELKIEVKPLHKVKNLLHYAPNKITEIKGNFGYMFERSKESADLKRQLYAKLKKTRVLFNEYGDYETLAPKYDYVIIANGGSEFTEELGCWRGWVNTYVKGAIVLGNFDPNTLIAWINKDYCKNGYAYLTPFDSKRASMVLIVTDVSDKEIDYFWELFLYTENIKYTIVEEFKLNHKSGHVYPHKIENIYFAGNSAGVIDPFLGFGQLSALFTGVMAARSITEGKDYERLIRNIVKQNLYFHEFRKGFDSMNNMSYNFLMASLGIPGIRHIIYDTRLNVVKYGAFILKYLPIKKN